MQQYDDFEYCKKVLQSGLELIKHNYSNDKTKRVKVWFSDDLSIMYYKTLQPGVIQCLIGATKSIIIDSTLGHFYGA